MTGYPEVISPTEIRFERLLPGPIENIWTYLTDAQKEAIIGGNPINLLKIT